MANKDLRAEYTVEIPRTLLVMLAAAGKMGDGETLKLHQFWAQKECKRLGLSGEVEKFQESVIADLKDRIKRVSRKRQSNTNS